MLERDYQPKVIRKIREMLPGCLVLKNDSSYIQGFPDLLILYGSKWAALEVKRSATARHQPNQEHYIQTALSMGAYASFIFPENEQEVLYEVQRALQP